MSKNLFNKIILFAVVLFLLILAPSALNVPSQTAVRAICTGLAIDKGSQEGQVTVSAQILIPEAGGQYTQKLSMVSQDGETVEDALELMEYQVGKKIRLAHCNFIILGKELCEQQNIATVMDYFLRGNNIANNTLLIYSDKEAKELLSKSSNINTNEVDNLQVIAKHNEKYVFSGNANLLSFYHDYLSPQRTSCMARITIKENGDTDSSSGTSGSSDNGESGGSSGGGGGGSSKNTQSDTVLSDGSVAVFYKGKLARILTNDEREQFNWFDSKITGTIIKLTGISDKVLNNADLAYSVTNKKLKFDYQVVNNIPTIKFKVDVGLKLEMVQQEDETSLTNYDNSISEAVSNAISTKIENDVQNMMKIQKEYGFDVFNIYKPFNIRCHSEWQKYLKSLENPEDYMKNIEVFVESNVYSAL